jgi:hypothetical protein
MANRFAIAPLTTDSSHEDGTATENELEFVQSQSSFSGSGSRTSRLVGGIPLCRRKRIFNALLVIGSLSGETGGVFHGAVRPLPGAGWKMSYASPGDRCSGSNFLEA